MTAGRVRTAATQDPAALEGESWILTQMLTAGGQTEIVQTGVSAQFDGSTISGSAGCNSYNASYEASGSDISFGPIAATKKICPEDEQSTEDRYLQLLAEIGSFEVSGRSMSMNDRTARRSCSSCRADTQPTPPEDTEDRALRCAVGHRLDSRA